MDIISRVEQETLKSYKNWTVVFGRRKTGKSFLIKNFAQWHEYYFVKRDKTILLEEGGVLSYETFLTIIKRDLQDNKTVVVDEFHRLGNDFLDYIHALKKSGKLILISSTLFLSKKLLGEKSPILGLFSEMNIKIIRLEDTIKALHPLKLTNRELIEGAILVREPIAISSFEKNKASRTLFSKIILRNINTIPALVGEIFLEEEKTLSAIYEGILRAIATGKIVSTEIADYLFSRKLIENNDASIVQQYLVNLVNFGIIRKIQVYNKKKFIYKHGSPLIYIFYYADEKYNISERDITEAEIERIVYEIMPRIVEDNVREFLAQKFALSEAIIEEKDYDIDVCLLKFNKPEIIVEVKWAKKIHDDDLKKALNTLHKINANKKYIFVPDKDEINKKYEIPIVDITDFI